jgi:peptide deformylase
MHILTISNPTANTTLRQACRPVTQEDMDSGLVAQIVESLRQHLEHYGNGVGLSAPQIGHNIQIAVIYCRPTEAFPSMTNFKAVLINPEVEERSDEMFDGYE